MIHQRMNVADDSIIDGAIEADGHWPETRPCTIHPRA